jgi:hypothetical protein
MWSPCLISPGTSLIGGWVGSEPGLDDLEGVEKGKSLNFQEFELLLICRPARSQSLYYCTIPVPMTKFQIGKECVRR